MKIAIASTKKDLTGEIYESGGRAPHYLIIDENNKLLESVKNPFAVGGGGAGLGVAKMLTDRGVNRVVVEKIGEKMEQALLDRGLDFELASGLAKDYL